MKKDKEVDEGTCGTQAQTVKNPGGAVARRRGGQIVRFIQ